MKNFIIMYPSKTRKMVPTIMFHMKNLATSIIFTTFQVSLSLAFLPPTEASNPLVPQEMSSIRHKA